MTVRELIEKLNKIEDKELLVFVNGYEGGLDDAELGTEVWSVLMNYNKDWYYGKHQRLMNDIESEGYEVKEGIIIYG
jgi:hypothetical protein